MRGGNKMQRLRDFFDVFLSAIASLGCVLLFAVVAFILFAGAFYLWSLLVGVIF